MKDLVVLPHSKAATALLCLGVWKEMFQYMHLITFCLSSKTLCHLVSSRKAEILNFCPCPLLLRCYL